MSFYPNSVSEILGNLQHSRPLVDADACSVASDPNCGTYIRFWIRLDVTCDAISDIGFTSNACGFAIAAAESLSRELSGKRLSELGGLTTDRLEEVLQGRLLLLLDRSHCGEMAIAAVHAAFANYRQRRLASFDGEEPLICTCFGVSESTIERAIKDYSLRTVEAVAKTCRAGLGCGSCRMLIQEIIDSPDKE